MVCISTSIIFGLILWKCSRYFLGFVSLNKDKWMNELMNENEWWMI